MKPLWLLFALLIFLGCGVESPEKPMREPPEVDIPHKPANDVVHTFGDKGWETRIKPGMSQRELLNAWGRPWSAYHYPRKIYAPEEDVWCYYTLGEDFAIVVWSYDNKNWDAPPELSAAIWGIDTDKKIGSLGNVTIKGAINGSKFLTDEEEIKRLYTTLYINYWKVKVI